jgi:hypothetical protein
MAATRRMSLSILHLHFLQEARLDFEYSALKGRSSSAILAVDFSYLNKLKK